MTNKLFMRIIASYIILCAIPLVTGMMAYDNAVRNAENQTIRLTGAALQRAAATTDNAISEIESITAGLSVNATISKMVSSRPMGDAVGTHSNMQNAHTALIYNKAISNNLLDIILYSDRSDTVITSTHMFIGLDRYYDHFFKYADMDMNGWRETVLNDASYTHYFPTQKIMMRSGAEDTTVKSYDAILYTRSVRTLSG